MTDKLEGFLYRIGRWLEAYKLRISHFRKMEIMLGKEHPHTLTSAYCLAYLLHLSGTDIWT